MFGEIFRGKELYEENVPSCSGKCSVRHAGVQESPRAAIMIWTILVNTQTHTRRETFLVTTVTVTVTVTETLVLRPLLEDRGRIASQTQSLVAGARRQNTTEITTK